METIRHLGGEDEVRIVVVLFYCFHSAARKNVTGDSDAAVFLVTPL